MELTCSSILHNLISIPRSLLPLIALLKIKKTRRGIVLMGAKGTSSKDMSCLGLGDSSTLRQDTLNMRAGRNIERYTESIVPKEAMRCSSRSRSNLPVLLWYLLPSFQDGTLRCTEVSIE